MLAARLDDHDDNLVILKFPPTCLSVLLMMRCRAREFGIQIYWPLGRIFKIQFHKKKEQFSSKGIYKNKQQLAVSMLLQDETNCTEFKLLKLREYGYNHSHVL